MCVYMYIYIILSILASCTDIPESLPLSLSPLPLYHPSLSADFPDVHTLKISIAYK